MPDTEDTYSLYMHTQKIQCTHSGAGVFKNTPLYFYLGCTYTFTLYVAQILPDEYNKTGEAGYERSVRGSPLTL